jgi:vitamin B12 transporter
MYKILAVALAGLLVQTSHSWSQTPQLLDPVVVTATKLETPVREVARSVTVVTEEEISTKQQTSVSEALRAVPAVDVVQQGGAGQQTSIFMRGANSEHTLVLIDGIQVNDPISPSRFFNFADLTTDNIERIEVFRGPGSTLYGSDALGGVINIITKTGQGGPRLTVSAEGGSYETHREKISFSGGNNWINYSLTASYLDSNGISAASREDGNRERDGYENISTSARLGLTPTDNFDIDFILRYIDSDADIDNSGGPGGDDPNFTLENKSLFFRAQASLMLFNDLWEQKLGFSLTDYDRESKDDVDTARPFDSSRSSYESNLYKIDWQNNLFLTERNTLTIGIDYEKEKGEQKDRRTFEDWEAPGTPASSSSEIKNLNTHITAYYLQDQIKLWDRFFTTLGVRLNDHAEFGTRTTYQAASTYLFPTSGTKIRASYGTGFRAPSLLQLYDPVFGGNPDLDPEKSTGWDVGVEQNLWNDRISLSLTYFENDFEDLIINVSAFDPILGFVSSYQNVDDAKTSGIEFAATCKVTTNIILRTSYTYTDTENEETGEQLLRRPQNKFSADLTYRFLDRGNVNMNLLYVGHRDDSFYNNVTFESGRTELASYTVVNLAASFNLTNDFRLFGRVDNLFDEEYEEVWGYSTAGIGGYAGAEYTF